MSSRVLNIITSVLTCICVTVTVSCTIYSAYKNNKISKDFDRKISEIKESYSQESKQEESVSDVTPNEYGEVTITKEQYDELIQQSKELQELKGND